MRVMREQAAEASTPTGRRAFGELSRAVVEPRLERAAEEDERSVALNIIVWQCRKLLILFALPCAARKL